jgi:transposase
MWKPEHRRAALRNDLRYPSDLTDAEWALVELIIHGAGKRIKGRKRHILVDTMGLLLNVVVHPADVQGRAWISRDRRLARDFERCARQLAANTSL